MPIANYGIVKGTALQGRVFPPHSNRDQPHYHIHMKGLDGSDQDVAVNVESSDGSEVLYFINNNFTPPNAAGLIALTTTVTRPDQSLALDYVRQKLVTREQMTLLPISQNAAPSTLHLAIDTIIQKAIAGNATIYAFGQTFQNANGRSPFWGFSPDKGVHDIHMDQGNPNGEHSQDNGTYQDGAIFIQWADGTWSAIFIAFQSQSFQTDDNGDAV